MARNCDIAIKIGTGALTVPAFTLRDSPLVLVPALRDYEIQEYPESPVAEISPKTTKKPYTYALGMLYHGATQAANAVITAWFETLFTTTSGVMVPYSLEIHNYYKKEKIVGYASALAVDGFGFATDTDAVGFTLNVYVPDPTACDYSMPAHRMTATVVSATRIDLAVNAGGQPFSAVTFETSATGTSGWSTVYSGANTTFSHTGLTAATDYYYRVKLDAGAYSYTVKATTLAS